MKSFFAFTIAALLSFALYAQPENPLWLRKSSISPDGKIIAFSYQGDIFTVSSAGGQARQLTSNSAYESDPIWTPDGKSIVFSSYRELSKDIYVTPAEGGAPKRLTDYTGDETPLTVLSDGTVVFSATIQTDTSYGDFPGEVQLYGVSLAGGKPERLSSLPVYNLSVAADGTMLYEDKKGYEDPLRKHHTSSVTRDVWMYKGDGRHIDGTGSFTKMSSFEGEDRQPVFAADGKNYYFLSEKSGNFNVWKGNVDTPLKAHQVTNLPTHPVRYLSVAADGTLAFSYNGELYTMKEGSEPRKLSVRIIKDQEERETILRSISSGSTGLAISPNGKEIAIVAHGDVFVTSVDYSSTRRITDTPGMERGVSFSEDGRELYYAAERDGHWGIWKTALTEKDDKYFTYSYKMKEELVTSKGQTCTQPAVSPDGKWLAFLRDRTDIVIKDVKSGEEKVLLQGANYSYQDGDQSFCWSPDSRKILCNYQANGGWNNSDVALIDIDNGEITNLTQSGYADNSFRWTMKGKAMTWLSDKAGYRSHGSWGSDDDVYIMFFDPKAYYEFTRDKEDDELEKMLATEKELKKEAKEEAKDSIKAEKNRMDKIVLSLDGRDDRIKRLTPTSGNISDHYLTDDGSKLYYAINLENGVDLCVLDIKKGDIKVLQKGVRGPFFPDKDGKYLFMPGGNGINRLELATGKITPITFSSEYDYRPAKEREYIFNHAWKQVSEKFYDETIHGIDWAGFRDNYARFLPYITNNFDFQELLSEMLGELNASHTGARYYYRGGLNTGRLGVIFDDSYAGEGLRIQEVLPGSNLALVDAEIKAGDIIKAIDGELIKAGTPWWKPLAMKGGKKILVTVEKQGAKAPVDLFVKATTSDNDLLYKRWVRQREDMVKKLSGGRVGYVHVQDMDSQSFREVYSDALGKYRTCDALIVDTRHNGGGWLHDDLVTLLSGKAYIEFKPRGQYIGSEPYNKWNKPSCVIIGEDNYSDASGFPYAYRYLGIGKLIGAPVPGTMTAVWWETQIDQTIVFGIPQVTSVNTRDGSILENTQIEPDILVYNDPASVLRGEDKQLEAAVAEMLKTIE